MASHETSLSLLERAGSAGDDTAWQRLHTLYVPVFQQWLRRYELQPADRDDLVQDVLTVVHRDGTELGRVDHLIETGANDVMVVKGEQERLIPFVMDKVILGVDLDKGEIEVDWEWD